MIMNYLKSLLWCFCILIISSIIITIFNYFNVINGIVLKIIFLIIPIISIFIGSYRLGKLSNEKGYIEGIKYGLIWVILFAVMYFLMIRPQKKRQKEEQEMRNALEIGDEIVTIGGIVGRVVYFYTW